MIATLAISKPFDLMKSFSICLLASCLIGLFASLKIYVPFTPIAFVLQMQLIFVLALFLGPKKASFSTILFLIQGAIGLPVLPGPTSFTLALGYYIGFVFAAFSIGYMVEKKRTYLNAFLSVMFANYVIIYFSGALILSFYIGIKNAIVLGILPFIIPDLIKNLLIIKLLKSLKWEKK